MTAEINREKIVETARRDLERNLFESNKVPIMFYEVRRDESGNFVPLGKEVFTWELSEGYYLSIGRSRGEEYYELYYPERRVRTETGKEVMLDYTFVRVGKIGTEDSPIKLKRLVMMGRYMAPEEEVYDAMSRYQAEIYIKKVGAKYAVAIKNVGRPGQRIGVYDRKGNKIRDIAYGEEALVGKGAYYLEFPGAYRLEGPDYSIAKKDILLGMILL